MMLNDQDFDLWADGYDKTVGLSEADDSFPFAGYREVLNRIYKAVIARPSPVVLDIGFGTGTLTAGLYARGCRIFGQDFSARMIERASEKMPGATLYQGDFSEGLVAPLMRERYDAILATYSLHHLTDAQKADFIRSLVPLLKENGCLYIGDVILPDRAAWADCRARAGENWDEDEVYFVYDELRQVFPALEYERVSWCAGILTLKK